MRRLVTLPLVALLLLAIAGNVLAKSASLKTGKYKGSGPASATGRVKAISFTAGRADLRVLKFALDAPKSKCGDGVRRPIQDDQNGYKYGNLNIRRGAFTVTGRFDGQTHSVVTLKGSLKGATAKGTLRTVRSNGARTITCDTGPLKWAATRRK